MRGNRRAILVDIHERKLNPKVAYKTLDKSGRMISADDTNDVTLETVEEKPVFASSQKVQQKVEDVVEEKAVNDVINNLKPAEIIEEQDGFLIPSIAKKIANVSSVEEEATSTLDVVADKKTKKKKKSV